jgi:hypothetical protein
LHFIHYSYLQSCQATYNSTGNVFHPDGAPTEIDIALTFVEAKALTREDLYGDSEDVDYDNTNYTYGRKSPIPMISDSDITNTAGDVASTIGDKVG